MARLSRTQKYAQLRDEIANDRESQLNTQELSKFEDKLVRLNVDSLPDKEVQPLNNILNSEEAKEEVDTTLEDILKRMNIEVERHIEPQVEETKEEEELVSIDDIEDLTEIEETPDEEVKEEIQPQEDKVETQETVSEVIPIETLMKSDIDDNYLKDTLNEVKAYNKSIGSLTVDEVPSTILKEIRGITDDKKEDEDFLSNTVTLEIKKILNELDETEEVEEKAAEVIEPQEEIISEPKEEVAPVAIEEKVVQAQVEPEVIEEVAEEKTEVTPNIELDEIRKMVSTLPPEVGDLLRTYLESTQEDSLNPKEEAEPEKELVAEEETNEDVQVSNTNEVIEEKEDDSKLMNETIPLVVDKSKVQVEFDDEEEKVAASSKVLNIILVVLIIILVLVLIAVAYLILVAQGILPSLF